MGSGAVERSRSYFALMGAYAALTATGAAAVRVRRVPIPNRLPLGDIALMGVATFKLSRLLTRDKVTMPIREPFADFDKPGEASEVLMKPKGHGLRRAVGELLTCPFCLSQWIATAMLFARLFAPRATRLGASLLTIVAIADTTQYVNAGIHKLEK